MEGILQAKKAVYLMEMEGYWRGDKCRIIEAVLLKKMIKESTDSFGEELEVLYVPQESPRYLLRNQDRIPSSPIVD